MRVVSGNLRLDISKSSAIRNAKCKKDNHAMDLQAELPRKQD